MKKQKWSQLIEDLQSPNTNRAVRACEMIAQLADESNIPELYSLLNDESFFVREAAAFPLVRLEGARALTALFQAYTRGFQEGHDNDGLSMTIIELLEAKPEEVAPLLLDMLKSTDHETRANAAWALGFTASQITPDVLLKQLETESVQEVRRAIIGSLGSFHESSEVIRKLIEQLNDSNEQIKIEAILALGSMGNKVAVAPLKEVLEKSNNGRVQEFAKYALKRLSS